MSLLRTGLNNAQMLEKSGILIFVHDIRTIFAQKPHLYDIVKMLFLLYNIGTTEVEDVQIL